MSEVRQINKSKNAVSKIAILALALVFAAGLFVVGFDQGHIFSLVYGEQAFVDLTIHELTHDMRHAAGFPCHWCLLFWNKHTLLIIGHFFNNYWRP